MLGTFFVLRDLLTRINSIELSSWLLYELVYKPVVVDSKLSLTKTELKSAAWSDAWSGSSSTKTELERNKDCEDWIKIDMKGTDFQ